MTLMALSLAIGILIDDAIVVRENIVRHVRHGRGPLHGGRNGAPARSASPCSPPRCPRSASSCRWPSWAASSGKFFREFGVTVAAAVAVSLFVSFTLDPMLSSVWYDPVAEGHGAPARARRALERFNDGFVGLGKRYRGVIGWALSHRLRRLGIAVGAFIAAMVLFPLVGGTFMPDADSGQLAVVGQGAGRLDARLHARSRARGVEPARARTPRWPTPTRRSPADSRAGERGGDLREARLARREKRDDSPSRRLTRRRLRAEIGTLPGMPHRGARGRRLRRRAERRSRSTSRATRSTSCGGSPTRCSRSCGRRPGAIEAESGLEEERPEVRHRPAARRWPTRWGSASAPSPRTLRPALAGEKASTWEDPSGEQHDVIVRLPQERAPVGRAARGAADRRGRARPADRRAADRHAWARSPTSPRAPARRRSTGAT